MKKLIFLFIFISFIGCSKNELPERIPSVDVLPKIKEITPPPKKEVAKYVYTGSRFTDPFISLNTENSLTFTSDETTIPNLNSLSLKGIIADGKEKLALISGGNTSFFIKGNKLYDNKKHIIKNFHAVIKKNSVIIYAPDNSKKELFFNEKI